MTTITLPKKEETALVPAKAMKRRRRKNPALVVGVTIIAFLTIFAVVGPHLTPYGPTQLGDEPFAPISAQHWLGTDNLGRDTFTRLAIATGYMVSISFLSTVIALVIGAALGLLAAYSNKMTDLLVMRGVEVVMSIPTILMALIVRVIFGPGFWPLVIALSVVSIPLFARVMRGPIMLLRERDFVVAAEIGGVRKVSIAVKHLLPNAMTPMVVQFANTASLAVLIESSLSYLGQGVQPPNPSAGRMVSEFTRYMQSEPQLVLIPAAMVTVLTVGWNLIADGLQNHLSPKNSNLQVPLTKKTEPKK